MLKKLRESWKLGLAPKSMISSMLLKSGRVFIIDIDEEHLMSLYGNQ